MVPANVSRLRQVSSREPVASEYTTGKHWRKTMRTFPFVSFAAILITLLAASRFMST